MKTDLSYRGLAISVIASFIAMVCVAGLSQYFLSGHGLPLLVASMGASTVILFAVYSSPMAKPWPLVGGHIISATVGVFCYQVIPDMVMAVGLAVSVSIGLMLFLRCLHPPGGAVALIAILGGDEVHDLGFQFVITPVGLNVLVMLVASLVFQWLLHAYNSSRKESIQDSWWEVEHTEDSGYNSFFDEVDLDSAMQNLDQYIDINRSDLSRILSLTLTNARTRYLHDAVCGEIMRRTPVSVEFATELDEVWRLMKEHDLKGLPVVNRVNHVIGIITVHDFLQFAEKMDGSSGQEKLKSLVARTSGHTSNKPEVAGQIMTSQVMSLKADVKLSAVTELFHTHDFHHVPIVDESNKLIGLITAADLTDFSQ